MIEIRPSTVDEMLASADILFEEHYQELAIDKTLMVLKPDVERYKLLEQNGVMMILAAFVGGVMAGYSVNLITNNLHYSDLKMCQNDILFVASAHRAGRLGLKLIKETERQAKQRGAGIMLWHAKPGTALEAIAPKLGYRVQDIMFSKGI